MKVAIMQPYIFPYIGYFQLINAVDHFVFYDDVNFIKQGWVNRNKILVQGKSTLFTVPLKKSSSFKIIHETLLHPTLFKKWKKKFLKTVEQSYKKAPYFDVIFPLVKRALDTDDNSSISEVAIKSVNEVLNYLQLERNIFISSTDFAETTILGRADRIIAITKKLAADEYVNSPGGKELYDKKYFHENGINLNFINSEIMEYDQGVSNFIPALSIIDVLMYNSEEEAIHMLDQYTLE